MEIVGGSEVEGVTLSVQRGGEVVMESWLASLPSLLCSRGRIQKGLSPLAISFSLFQGERVASKYLSRYPLSKGWIRPV